MDQSVCYQAIGLIWTIPAGTPDLDLKIPDDSGIEVKRESSRSLLVSVVIWILQSRSGSPIIAHDSLAYVSPLFSVCFITTGKKQRNYKNYKISTMLHHITQLINILSLKVVFFFSNVVVYRMSLYVFF